MFCAIFLSLNHASLNCSRQFLHFIKEVKFSDEQLKFIIHQFSKGLTAIAVKRNFLQTYVIWGRQRSKFTLTNFQRACGVSICNGRLIFCCWFLSQDRNFHSKVLWSDATLWVLDPESNSQKDRIWARRMIKNQERAQKNIFCVSTNCYLFTGSQNSISHLSSCKKSYSYVFSVK